MSLRSAFTKLVDGLSALAAPTPEARPAPRRRSTWIGVVALGGLVAGVAVVGEACDGGGSLVPCANSGGYCVCDSYGCRTAENNTGAGGSLGTGGATSTTGTGGASAGGTSTGGAGTGGDATCDPGQATCPCDKKGSCPTGKECIVGLCIKGCSFDYQCAAGMVCDNGACVPGCSANAACATGYTCTNGACQLDPNNPQCSAASPCPAGQVCASGVCTTSCTSDSQCAAGQVCDGATQTCITNPSSSSPCSNVSCPSPQSCGMDGFCHYPCSTLHDCQLIDNRFAACDQGTCKTSEEVNPQCTLQMPCPSGQSCISNHCY